MRTESTTHTRRFALLLAAALAAVFLVAPADAALWTPSQLTSGGTYSWYDASDTGTITASGNNATAMQDKGTNNKDLTVAVNSTGRQPTTGVNTINGLNVLTFDNSSGYQSLWDTTTGVTVQEMYSVVQYTSLTSNRPTIIGDRLSTNYALQLEVNTGTGAVTGINGGTFYQNGSATSNENGSQLANPTLVRRDWNVTDFKVSLGSDRDQNTRSHNGYIAEVIIVGEDLSVDDRLRMEGYLAWKWGLEDLLPNDHEYKNAAPVPEPGSLALMGIGALLIARRRGRY